MTYLLPYLTNLTTFTHTVHIFFYFSIVFLNVRLFIRCVTQCCYFCRTALLHLGQVAVVNATWLVKCLKLVK